MKIPFDCLCIILNKVTNHITELDDWIQIACINKEYLHIIKSLFKKLDKNVLDGIKLNYLIKKYDIEGNGKYVLEFIKDGYRILQDPIEMECNFLLCKKNVTIIMKIAIKEIEKYVNGKYYILDDIGYFLHFVSSIAYIISIYDLRGIKDVNDFMIKDKESCGIVETIPKSLVNRIYENLRDYKVYYYSDRTSRLELFHHLMILDRILNSILHKMCKDIKNLREELVCI